MSGTGNLRKAKLYSSRQIRTQVNDSSFSSEGGKLLIPQFLQSRQFEIESLERAQLQSKYSGAARCFQTLPRTLRRRVASHNVKRIPKRLRNRAIREMSEGTVSAMKKQWKSPRIRNLRGKQRYRLLMTKKLLLIQTRMKYMRSFPKNYRLTSNTQKRLLRHIWKGLNRELRLQRQEKAKDPHNRLNNRVGAYDNYGRGGELAERPTGNIKYWKRQRDYVWLTSHMWHVKRFHMLKIHGWQIPLLPTQKCFKSMNRAKKQDCVIFDTSYLNHMVVRTRTSSSTSSIFNDFVVPLAKITQEEAVRSSGVYEGLVYYRRGNSPYMLTTLVLIYWNGDTAIVRTYPSAYEELFAHVVAEYANCVEIDDCRYAIGSLELRGPKALELLTKNLSVSEESELLQLWNSMAKFPDTYPTGSCLSIKMSDPRIKKRKTSGVNSIASLSFIDLLKMLISHRPTTTLTDHAERYASYEEMKSIKEVQKQNAATPANVPILLIKLQSSSWTLLMPWYWILPTWHVLVKSPKAKPGGQKQIRQFNFEAGIKSYPIDFPFTPDGWHWQQTQKTIKALVYSKLPKSKRINFDQYEGPLDPHGSDWEFLRRLHYELKELKQQNKLPLDTGSDFAKFNYERDITTNEETVQQVISRNITLVHDLVVVIKSGMAMKKSFPARSICLQDPKSTTTNEEDESTKIPILPVKSIGLKLGTGLLKDNARIYRWCADPSDHNKMIVELIGFISSGGMNLDLGKLLGIGCVVGDADLTGGKVLVRNIGQTIFHEATVKEL
ncbi:uncharacterized protein KQ657_004762 [Scheffersomyces spartinae]|uniref:Uncharacterized protein n=1 Tax=Scheffersomyces spartinae TaxID=45513 RepID=A0A9P7VAW3_9ASCO|nr:uncharacterized protein KQ657_004762 [Scheffersomyces spartinae]KAG7194547.1 hypothetical protein KQ657_004762 [Scheffersomyces spartinae]